MAMAYYRKPDWLTKNVFNRAVELMTRAGVSVWGSRILPGPRAQVRRVAQPSGQPADLRGQAIPRRTPRSDAVGPQHSRRRRRRAGSRQQASALQSDRDLR